jgi:ADP-dependent NAD(P)H-hydrate dehydratase / NAD(P)H-hydrate epimerase
MWGRVVRKISCLLVDQSRLSPTDACRHGSSALAPTTGTMQMTLRWTRCGRACRLFLDGGALHLHEKRVGPLVLTPHFRELARIFDADVEHIADDPGSFALMASRELSATVVLKGHSTYIAGPGSLLVARSAPTWLATAGAGDSLAGILGALIATNAFAISHDERLMPKLAATACVLHGLAAHRASGGGPLTILGLNEALPATIAELRLA